MKEMSWSTMPFGKYKGKTLPEIIVSDLDWFYWALPKLYGKLEAEAQDLAQKVRVIKIPSPDRKKLEVEYRYERDDRFCAGQPDFHTSICRGVFVGSMTSEGAVSCSVIFGVIILARTNG